MTISALSIPFCCLLRWALVKVLGFDCFFVTPAFARSERMESRCKTVGSARGADTNDLSKSALGEPSRLAARECFDWANGNYS